MKRALISHLHAVAQSRKAGYLEACHRAGVLSSDKLWLVFTEEDHAILRQHYTSENPGTTRGLGERLHKIAGPIGRAVKWPCMKGDGTTDLKPNSPCAKFRRALNAVKI